MNLIEPSVSLSTLAGALLLAASLMFLVGGYPGVLRQRTGMSIPEGRWEALRSPLRAPYTPASVHHYLLSAGRDGWHVYRVALWWDIVYSAVFAVTGFVLVNALWGVADGVPDRLLLVARVLPLAAGAIDVVEDALLLTAVGGCPVPAGGVLPGAGVIAAAGVVTRLKFLAYALTLIALIAGAGWLVVRG